MYHVDMENFKVEGNEGKPSLEWVCESKWVLVNITIFADVVRCNWYSVEWL